MAAWLAVLGAGRLPGRGRQGSALAALDHDLEQLLELEDTMLEADAIAFWPAAAPLMPQVPVTFTDGDISSGVEQPFDKRNIPSGEGSFGKINVVGGDRHIETNAKWFKHSIPAHMWGELKAEGLLRQDAPTP